MVKYGQSTILERDLLNNKCCKLQIKTKKIPQYTLCQVNSGHLYLEILLMEDKVIYFEYIIE